MIWISAKAHTKGGPITFKDWTVSVGTGPDTTSPLVSMCQSLTMEVAAGELAVATLEVVQQDNATTLPVQFVVYSLDPMAGWALSLDGDYDDPEAEVVRVWARLRGEETAVAA